MSFIEDRVTKLLRALRGASPADMLGSAGVASGIVLVVFGIVLQDDYRVGFGATIRSMGGALLLSGLGAVLFVESRRRAAIIGAAGGTVQRYRAATVRWRWTNRMGLAGVVIGALLFAPSLFLQIIFGAGGAIVMLPGIVLFWTGAALLIYGFLRRPHAAQNHKQSSEVSPSRGKSRGDRR